MELPLPSLSGFQPATGTLEQWNEAYVRVEDYLRAHRIHNRLHQSRVILVALQRAAERHAQDPSIAPTTLAAEEIAKMMEEWFATILDDGLVPKERISSHGRLALLMTDGPGQWPYSFLDRDATSPELRVAMKEISIKAGPNLQISDMVPRPIDLGPISEAAGEAWETIDRWPVIRTLVFWALIAAFLLFVFWVTR